MADCAWAYGWTPQVLGELEVAELLAWHSQIQRIGEELQRGGARR